MSLTRSKDRKVTNAVSPNGKTPTIANAFGLPAGKAYSCPGATEVCEKVCYAGKLEKVYKGVKNILVSNYEQLVNATLAEMTLLLDEMIQDFRKDCDKRGAEKLFRIHWDGDFFSRDYALAWAVVIRANWDIQFWAYTRSDFAVEALAPMNLENLALYFSTDSANRALGIKLKKQYGVKLAYLANTFAEGKADFKELQEKSAVPCPENNRKLPLISEQGSACVRCSQCVFARNDILFSVTKK
jgi:ferredoxin